MVRPCFIRGQDDKRQLLSQRSLETVQSEVKIANFAFRCVVMDREPTNNDEARSQLGQGIDKFLIRNKCG